MNKNFCNEENLKLSLKFYFKKMTLLINLV